MQPLRESLKAAKPMRSVEVMPSGQTMAYVADSNGFGVALCTPMDGVPRAKTLLQF
jgi:hypothetical protein